MNFAAHPKRLLARAFKSRFGPADEIATNRFFITAELQTPAPSVNLSGRLQSNTTFRV
jgi:hypothetical protein